MASQLVKDAFEQLKKERALREVTNDKEVVEKIRDHLSDNLDVGTKILKHINEILDKFSDSIDTTTSTTLIHDVNNATMTRFSELRVAIQKERKENFLSLLKERESLDIKLQKLLIAEKKMPESAFVA